MQVAQEPLRKQEEPKNSNKNPTKYAPENMWCFHNEISDLVRKTDTEFLLIYFHELYF